MRYVIATMMAAAAVGACGAQAEASVVRYTNKQQWKDAVNNDFTTITFADLPNNTLVTTQYAHMGATFVGAFGYPRTTYSNTYVNDGVGLYSLDRPITVTFSTPMNWVGVDFPAFLFIQLYRGSTMIYYDWLNEGDLGVFGGVVSTESFDRIVLFRTLPGDVFIDDLHFGASIPAPGAGALLLGAGALGARRRRRKE